MSLPDRVDQHSWRDAACARMETMFPVNRGLRPMALLMANAHPRAVDYIEQAPVIVLAATHGKHPITRSERAFIQEQLRGLCERGAKLRDVMRVYGLPIPLRKLDVGVLSATRATVVRRLALMNPSTLAQIIPSTRREQNAWLRTLDLWCGHMRFHSFGPLDQRKRYSLYASYIHDRVLFFEWAATRYPGISYGASGEAQHMADFVCACPDTFNPRWSRERARAEEQNWHAELGRDTRIPCSSGIPADTVIDYAPLPLRWERDGFTFVALQTGTALHSEGAAMHHCVKTYWGHVISGQSRIYSIRCGETRVATLEVGCQHPRFKTSAHTLKAQRGPTAKNSRYQLRQLVGHCNLRATPGLSELARSFVAELNDSIPET